MGPVNWFTSSREAKHDLSSIESDHTRRDFSGLLGESGCKPERRAPKFDDPHLQVGIPWYAHTYYYLFRKVA
jgi:hypothetical protein